MNTNIRYLVKVTAIATDDNPNFKGAIYTYYYGSNQHLLGAASNGIEPPEYMELCPYFIEQYGYKTRNTSKAIKFWTTLNNESPSIIDGTRFWTYTAETVAYDLASQSLITL